MGRKILQISQPFAFLALDSLSELAIACACGRRFNSGTTAVPGWNARAYIANIKVETLTPRAIHLFQ